MHIKIYHKENTRTGYNANNYNNGKLCGSQIQ